MRILRRRPRKITYYVKVLVLVLLKSDRLDFGKFGVVRCEKQPHDGLLRREKHSHDALLRCGN